MRAAARQLPRRTSPPHTSLLPPRRAGSPSARHAQPRSSVHGRLAKYKEMPPEAPDGAPAGEGEAGLKLPLNTCGCGNLEALPDCFGPFLRFGGYEPDGQMWTGSVLLGCTAAVGRRPRLAHSAPAPDSGDEAAAGGGGLLAGLAAAVTGKDTWVEGQPLDTIGDWTLWRYDLRLPMGAAPARVTYRLDVDESRRYDFHLAGARCRASPLMRRPSPPYVYRSPYVSRSAICCKCCLSAPPRRAAGVEDIWRTGFASCSGFSNDVPLGPEREEAWGAFDKLWVDLLAQHAVCAPRPAAAAAAAHRRRCTPPPLHAAARSSIFFGGRTAPQRSAASAVFLG